MDYICHYGVKGMKWGVRNEETRAKYENSNYPMTKRQAKKAIKQAKRSYRKSTGKWMTTGKNVAKVDKARETAKKNDSELKNLTRQRDDLEKQIDLADYKAKKAWAKSDETKDHLTRLQQDPESKKEMRRSVEEKYLKQKKAAVKAQDKAQKLYDAWENADAAYDARSREISESFYEKYKTAVVKDLNISDIERGKQMLDEYGLTKKALRWGSSRRI